jgi:3,4-dihydroxy 2-butanone 4-phosphate synthase/GTP cyclohydrolase II
MTLRLDPVEDAIKAIAEGQMVIVVDDEDRENEGDLIMAASLATPEQVAFIIRHTSGILCTPLESKQARRLGLMPMVPLNDAPLATAFTVSIDYRINLTTGISAAERCNTITALTNPNVQGEDFVRPGHVFPLVARDGGVLMRTGHTEAAVDLARMAGLPAVGLISELVNDDGTVKRGPQIQEFAQVHGLKLISIDDMIAYRQQREQLVTRTAEQSVSTSIGPALCYSYKTPFDDIEHLALVFGQAKDGDAMPVRFHLEDVVADVFQRDGSTSLDQAMQVFEKDGRGVLVYLRKGATGVTMTQSSLDHDATATDHARMAAWRDVGLGAQILSDLGVSKIKLLASKQRQYIGLHGFGIEITETDLF